MNSNRSKALTVSRKGGTKIGSILVCVCVFTMKIYRIIFRKVFMKIHNAQWLAFENALAR